MGAPAINSNKTVFDTENLKKEGLFRSLNPVTFWTPTQTIVWGQPFINFSSNNYLGLTHHPKVLAAAEQAIKEWGAGSGASRLITGDLDIHEKLEIKLAAFKNEEASIIFSSGYLANLGAITAFLTEKDVVLVDKLNHASLIDAARLSKAKLWVYPHRDIDSLRKLLKKCTAYQKRLVLTDAYFSMDGTVAPLAELLTVCRETDSQLLIDEAHSTGVYGKTGRGLTEHFGLQGQIDFVMGTLSKSLGSVGGYVSGSKKMKEFLVNRARSFIYTTAPAPSASAAAAAALSVIEEERNLIKKLWENTRRVREGLGKLGFDLMGSEGPIIPVKVGDTNKVMAFQEFLRKEGFYVAAIRPPTVPKKMDRLRLSISAVHDEENLKSLIAAFRKYVK